MEDKDLLRIARAISGLDQSELSEVFGYHRSYVWCMEKGIRKVTKPIREWTQQVILKFLEHFHNQAVKLIEKQKNEQK